MLVDTSAWIDHLRAPDARLRDALQDDRVVTHPFVIGELACGQLRRRAQVLSALAALPQVGMATHAEVLAMIETRSLAGAGLGWVDAHLLAAARLGDVALYTHDRRLAAAADRLRVRRPS